MIQKINLNEKFNQIRDLWSPRIAGDINDACIKLVKLKGEFVWHHHEAEDELFLVVRGELLLRLRDGDVRLREGEFAIVPRGVEHLPIAEHECWVLLVEPKTTLNTGNLVNERTIPSPARI
jgi:mannose-6-phosphate isomerase-like protein (cupin superfamily)